MLASIPVPVMGGIMMLMFGSVAARRAEHLIKARVDLEEPRNLVIVSSVLVMGHRRSGAELDGLTCRASACAPSSRWC